MSKRAGYRSSLVAAACTAVGTTIDVFVGAPLMTTFLGVSATCAWIIVAGFESGAIKPNETRLP